MLIDDVDKGFIRTGFPQVEGWCDAESAYFATCLLNRQTEAGYDAAVLEIGVFKGKFLSVLYQKARRTCQPVVGIDRFEWSSADEVMHQFEEIFGSTGGLSLVKADSRHLEAPAALEMMGGRKASFISVDGNHTAAGVQSDLPLAQKLLREGGIYRCGRFPESKSHRSLGGDLSVFPGINGKFRASVRFLCKQTLPGGTSVSRSLRQRLWGFSGWIAGFADDSGV